MHATMGVNLELSKEISGALHLWSYIPDPQLTLTKREVQPDGAMPWPKSRRQIYIYIYIDILRIYLYVEK